MSSESIVVIAGAIICLICFGLEIHQHLKIARHILPQVRRVATLEEGQRIAILDEGQRVTNDMRFNSLIALCVCPFPPLFLLAHGGRLVAVLAFAVLAIAQIFVVGVARNHCQIVKQAVEQLPRQERKALFEFTLRRLKKTNKPWEKFGL